MNKNLPLPGRQFNECQLENLDGTEQLIIDEAVALVGATAVRAVVVLGDVSGGLTCAAAECFTGAQIRVFNDSQADLARVLQVAGDAGKAQIVPGSGLNQELFHGADLVIGRLPKHLAELEEWAIGAAFWGAADVKMVLGEKEKYLVRAMNSVLEMGFVEVSASLGRAKSRVLRAVNPKNCEQYAPESAHIAEIGFDIAAHGAAFAGASLDQGTRVLLRVLAEQGLASWAAGKTGFTVLDLGCGTGVLALTAKRAFPQATVIATDRSWAAAQSAAENAVRNGLELDTRWETSAVSVPDASVDLVLCNPPFHAGRALDPLAARTVFQAAVRVLRPGGVMFTVYNGHLRHRADLERYIGNTEQIYRDPKFIVTKTVRAVKQDTQSDKIGIYGNAE